MIINTMCLISVPTIAFDYAIDMETRRHMVEEWCETNLGPYAERWYWVMPYGNNLILRIIQDDDATAFKLAMGI